MLRVFLAEDEVYVIELLKSLIDWSSLGIEIVGTAVDGNSALNRIIELKPDIVVTDIRMPGIDGLELIEKAHREDENISFIIISGHQNFEYVQTAMRSGVYDYLLKPIKADDLTRAIKHVVAMRNKVSASSEENRTIYKNLDSVKQKMNMLFLERFAQGNIENELTNIENINEEYLISLADGSYQFAVCKVDYSDKNKEVFELIRKNIISEAVYLFKPLCKTFIIGQNELEFVMLLNYEFPHSQEITETFSLMLRSLFTQFKDFGKLYFTIGLGSVHTEVSGLSKSYKDAHEALETRIIVGTDKVIEAPMSYDVDRIVAEIFNDDVQNEILKKIEQTHLQEIKNNVQQLFRLIGERKEPASVYFAISNVLYTYILKSAEHLNLTNDINEEIESFKSSVKNAFNVDMLKQLLLNRIEYIASRYESAPVNKENIAITIAKKYIKSHYREKITLSDIAELVYLNPVYFSILFKRQCGKNFVNYVNEYRINIAKPLLKDIKYSVSEVSELAGFTNVKYFSNMFKKSVGITPTGYRNMHMR